MNQQLRCVVEVFKTDVKASSQARKLVKILLHHFPTSKINFDLDDCDRILRVEGINFKTEKIIVLMKERGFDCKVLDDIIKVQGTRIK